MADRALDEICDPLKEALFYTALHLSTGHKQEALATPPCEA